MTLEECIRKELTWLKKVIAKGQGTWPRSNYIQNDVWICFLAQERVLKTMLNNAELEKK